MKKKISLLLIITFLLSCKKESDYLIEKKKIDFFFNKLEKTEKTKKADSVYNVLKKSKLNLINRYKYTKLLDIYLELNNKKYVDIANYIIINKSNPINYNERSYCYALIGNYYYNISDYENSYFYLNNAENNYKKLNDFQSISFIKLSKANILTFKKDFVGAEKMVFQSLKIGEKSNNKPFIYHSYITLGNCLLGLKNYPKSIEYYQKALATSDELTSNPFYFYSKIEPLSYISSVYNKQKNYREASKYAQKGLAFANIKEKEPKLYCYLTNNLGYAQFKLGKKTAIANFEKTLKMGDSLQFAPIQITSKIHLGEYHLAEKDTTKAISYLVKAKEVAHKNKLFEDELLALQLLAKANPTKNTFYLEKYIALNDSLHQVERATRDKFARIEFETDEITEQKEVVEEVNNVLYSRLFLLIGFTVLLLLLIIMWFKNKSQKAKTKQLVLEQEQLKDKEEIYNLMLAQQQNVEEGKNIEKKRISLELHDGVMGKLTAVRLNLYAALYKNKLLENPIFSKQLEEIQLVEKEIRTIAHDLNATMFGYDTNFKDIVQQLVAKTENYSDTKFHFNGSDTINWELVSNTIKINLYRIIQEALQNIEKYANASQVSIEMNSFSENQISVTISDNGIGFETSKVKNGIGLQNMKTRMTELNGQFSLQSKVGKGTKINLKIPI